MTNTSVVKSRAQWFRLAAVAIFLMAVTSIGGSVSAFGQSTFGARTNCQGPEDPWFDACPAPEGSWLYTVTIPNPTGAPTVFQGVETYAAGGGYSEADQLSFTPGLLATAGHGAWKSTGERTFLLTYLNLTYDASGNATGSSKVRQITRIDRNERTTPDRGTLRTTT